MSRVCVDRRAGAIALSTLSIVVAGVSAGAHAADPAFDSASDPVYLQFPNPDGLNGLNAGTGFGPWTTSKTFTPAVPGWTAFAGWFQAYGGTGPNPDLQDIGSGPALNAWASYANSNQPGQGLAVTSATRSFTGGPLLPGQTFEAEFEHGNISFYPVINDVRPFGWTGVVLHTTTAYAPDPFQNGLGTFVNIGVGFRGGASNYEIISPAGSIDTGVPFSRFGIRAAFEVLADNSMNITVTRFEGNTSATIAVPPAQFFGPLNGFGLINRNAQEANVFFNNVRVTGTPIAQGACCAGATCALTTADSCATPGQRFAGAGTVCNAAGITTTPCCLGDFNQSGTITVQDLFDFLAAWFAQDSRSNINGGNITVQDLFDFLSAWFGGC